MMIHSTRRRVAGLLFLGVAIAPHPTASAKQFAYVTTEERSSIAVIDTDIDAVVAEIPIALGNADVAISSDETRAYIVDTDAARLRVIDLVTRTRLNDIPVGLLPTRMALSPDGRFAYVSGFPTVEVDLLTGITFPILDSAIVRAITFSRDGRYAYLATIGFGDEDYGLAVVDTLTHDVYGLAPDYWAKGVALSPTERFAYLSLNRPGSATARYAVVDLITQQVVLDVLVPRSHGGPVSGEGIAASDDGMHVYLSFGFLSAVLVLNAASGELEETLEGELSEKRFAAIPHAKEIFVAGLDIDGVSVIDTEAQSVSARFHLGKDVLGIAASADGRRVYAAAQDGLHIIDAAARSEVGLIPGGRDPLGLAATADGRFLYVANRYSGSVGVIDLERRVETDSVQTGGQPLEVVIAPNQERAYVSSFESPGRVFVIDLATNQKVDEFPVAGEAAGIAIAPDGRTLFVSDYGFGAIGAIDLPSGMPIYDLGIGVAPRGLALSRSGDMAVVARRYGLGFFDPTKSIPWYLGEVDLAPYQADPCGVVFSYDGTRVFASGVDTSRIEAIDVLEQKVVASTWINLPIGTQTCGIALEPLGPRLYVADNENKTVSVLDSANLELLHQIPVPPKPYGIAISCPGGCPTATIPPTETPTPTRTSTSTRTPSPTPVLCHSDCSHDGIVTVDEIVANVAIALDLVTQSSCLESGADPHSRDRLVLSVRAALSGCSPIW